MSTFYVECECVRGAAVGRLLKKVKLENRGIFI